MQRIMSATCKYGDIVRVLEEYDDPAETPGELAAYLANVRRRRMADFKRKCFQVLAEVEVQFANGYTIEVRSPGLSRIQADPDDSYLDTIFAEERTVLVDMLDDMGVTVTERPMVRLTDSDIESEESEVEMAHEATVFLRHLQDLMRKGEIYDSEEVLGAVQKLIEDGEWQTLRGHEYDFVYRIIARIRRRAGRCDICGIFDRMYFSTLCWDCFAEVSTGEEWDAVFNARDEWHDAHPGKNIERVWGHEFQPQVRHWLQHTPIHFSESVIARIFADGVTSHADVDVIETWETETGAWRIRRTGSE